MIWKLKETFGDNTPSKNISFFTESASKFHIYFRTKYRNGFRSFLSIYPFGHNIKNDNGPLLLVEERYYKTMLTRKNNLEKVLSRLEYALKNSLYVELADRLYNDENDITALKNDLKNKLPKEIYVNHLVSIDGKKIASIRNEVGKILQNISDYYESNW